METPETRYAKSGDMSIAYQVTGEGPFDLVYIPPFTSHVELAWGVPAMASFNERFASFRGREIDTAGDGFFASFDGPARGIRCARAIQGVGELGLEVRAGLHSGECELLEGKVAGTAVSIGARVAAQAPAGEVLVSQTVKDLVAGSGIEFAERAIAELKGVPGEWRLYAVAAA